jgi:protoporphyrinogen oxidase
MESRAIIAGAGPAGLTAAYELLQRTDVRPVVFEMSDIVGGIAQTYNYKGNRIDLGGHRFFSKSDRVMNWWFNILPPQGAPARDEPDGDPDTEYATEVLVRYLCPECSPSGKRELRRSAPDPEREDTVMLKRNRISHIFYRRRFFPYPISITLTIAWRLGLLNTALITVSYIKAKLFPLKDETYLDAFFTNRFGRRLYQTFFKDYTEKVWGVPCSKIRADWGSQRIKGLSLKRAVAHAVRDLLSSNFRKEQRERETSLITRFYYPKLGPGQMWETVTEQVQKCGGDIRMKHRISGISLHENRVSAVTVENMETGATTEEPCDYFFSTMPIKHLVGMIRPHPPARVCEVADGLQYRDFLTVGLLLKKLHVQQPGMKPASTLPDTWIYIQEGDVEVGRVQVFNNWSPYMVADPENTVWIGLEYFVNEGDALWIQSDEDLIALGIKEMESIGFLRKEDVLDGCVRRMPKAYPAYFGSYDQLHVVQEYVQEIGNLFLIGRNGLHKYNNQDHSMLTAMVAVDNIVEGRTDTANIWSVNAERAYHEEKSASEG